MTTNIYINYITKDIPKFIGVSSIDTLVSPSSFPSYTVVNFSASHLPGTHFISILFLSQKLCLYFDSLNLPTVPVAIFDYMQKAGEDIIKIDYTVQSPLTVFCGFYSLIPIMLHVNNLPILKGVLSFNVCALENDEL